MNVKQLIETLKAFPDDAPVRVGIAWPDRVSELHESLWVGDYGGGPQINAMLDYRPFTIYVGCGLEQFVSRVPEIGVDLGSYESDEIAAKVRDFYVIHRQLDEPLHYPGFDYDDWLPPRTVSGEYNEHIARILREKLLSD